MTYYEILGISSNASQEDIKSAYKKLIKKYHPDLYQGDKTFAEKKTKEINEAYDTLSDANKRSNYDLKITPSYTETNNYSYTPPKYSSDYNPYSYNNYYKNRYYSKYNNQQSSTNYSSKTDTKDVRYKEFSKKLEVNMIVILSIFIAYLIIFIATLMQYKSFQVKKSNKNSNPPVINNYEDDNSEEFDINDYFSDSELLELYNKNYKDVFETFSDFKEAYSQYLQEYYSF